MDFKTMASTDLIKNFKKSILEHDIDLKRKCTSELLDRCVEAMCQRGVGGEDVKCTDPQGVCMAGPPPGKCPPNCEFKEEPKILAIRPRWNDGIANSPELEILLSRIGECGEFKFIKEDTIYYSELGAEVMFYAHHLENPEQNAGGFSGSSFDLTMEDGNKIKLVGPWSSRAGAVNGLGLGPCIDVSITDKPEVMEVGHTFITGHVTLKSVQDWLEEHGANLDWELTTETQDRETTWIPKLKEG